MFNKHLSIGRKIRLYLKIRIPVRMISHAELPVPLCRAGPGPRPASPGDNRLPSPRHGLIRHPSHDDHGQCLQASAARSLATLRGRTWFSPSWTAAAAAAAIAQALRLRFSKPLRLQVCHC
jgi:hypothetical protein